MESLIIVGVWLGMGALGSYLAAQGGRHAIVGWGLGLLAGPIGLIVVALLPPLTTHRAVPVPYKKQAPKDIDDMDVGAWLGQPE